jgi:hypothetical protein
MEHVIRFEGGIYEGVIPEKLTRKDKDSYVLDLKNSRSF